MAELFHYHELTKQQRINSSTRANIVNNAILKSFSETGLSFKIKSRDSNSPREHKQKDPYRFMPKRNYLKKDLFIDKLLGESVREPKEIGKTNWKINSFYPNSMKKMYIANYTNLKDGFRNTKNSFNKEVSVQVIDPIRLPDVRKTDSNVLLYLGRLIDRRNRSSASKCFSMNEDKGNFK
jgi:hypothetical protein